MSARIGTYVRNHHLGLIAIFISLTGTAYAATSLPTNSVGTKQLINGSVTHRKLARGAVDASNVRRHSLTGTQINASTLGTVPNATHATNADQATNASQLGGTSAASYQHTMLGSCPAHGAVEAIGPGGELACNTPVVPIAMSPAAGVLLAQDLGNGLKLLTVCHDGGMVKMAFQNIGPDAATLNWLYSGGGATVAASGVVLPAGGLGEQDFTFVGARIEGQFIFANGAGITTVNLHAFDGATYCEVRGTAEFA